MSPMYLDPPYQHTRPGIFFTPTERHDTYPYISPKNHNLQGKRVLITGASKGVGHATALSYAKAGCSYIALGARSSLSKNVTEILTAAKEAGHPEPHVLPLEMDVTSEQSVQAAFEKVKDEFNGNLDVLINNAGSLTGFSPIPTTDTETWWRDQEVNVKGTYTVTHVFLSLLLSSPSSLKIIINISSIGAVRTSPFNSSYSTAKLSILRFTEYLDQDHGPRSDDGVVAIAMHPGGVKTELATRMPEYMHEHLVDTVELAGDTIFWLGSERREWLGGRYVSANWDMEELSGREGDVVKGDLLKMKLVV